MRYWAYLAAKVALLVVVLKGFHTLLTSLLPKSEPFSFPMAHRERYYIANDPMAHDLTYTFAMLGFFLLASGLAWLIVWDQRYRCRTCLRWLRMPVSRGSWTHILLGRP